MTAIDVQLGRQLAEHLNGVELGRIKTVQFSFDAYQQVEKVGAQPWVIISPDELNEERASHGPVWTHEVALQAAMMTRAAPNVLNSAFMEELFASWDLLVDEVKKSDYCMAVERTVRFQSDQLQEKARLLMQAVLRFNIL